MSYPRKPAGFLFLINNRIWKFRDHLVYTHQTLLFIAKTVCELWVVLLYTHYIIKWGTHAFNPVNLIPCTKYFCANINTKSIGMVAYTNNTIIKCHPKLPLYCML